jgi:hypothetical protein
MVGKRDPYVNHPKKEDKVWTCACGHSLKENPRNPVMGFYDWSGVLVCPECNRSMTRKGGNNE